MRELVQTIQHGQGLGFAIGGILAAAFLWLLLSRGAARESRRRLALPLFLLCAYIALDALMDLISAPSALRYMRLFSLLILLLALGRLLTVLVVDWLVGRRLQREAPRIVREIVEGTLIIVALLVTMRVAGVDTTSLLTTSALLTAIVGLSLQDTLGNLFAGLSLQAQRPFAVGEWIQIDREGLQIGEVIEINWRATKLRTLESAELIVPNAVLARSSILNQSRPRRAVRRSVLVTVPHEIPPPRVHAVIEKAVAQLEGVLGTPAVTVVTQGFAEHGVIYAVLYYIEDFSRRDILDGSVRDRVSLALGRAGIPISATVHAPAPMTLPGEAPPSVDRALSERIEAIRGVDFLQDLPDSAIATLAADSRTEHYERGEIVVRQGERGQELYLCRSGELVVSHAADGGPHRELARTKVGGMFGELAQMSGEPRAATVQAVSACELVVIGKPAFSQILADNPGFADLISQRMAERLATLDEMDRQATLEEQRESVTEHKSRLLQRLRELFSLG